jgi:hypothetical protein
MQEFATATASVRQTERVRGGYSYEYESANKVERVSPVPIYVSGGDDPATWHPVMWSMFKDVIYCDRTFILFDMDNLKPVGAEKTKNKK